MCCLHDIKRSQIDHMAHGTVLLAYVQAGQWQRVLREASSLSPVYDNIEDVLVGCAVAEACVQGWRLQASPSVFHTLGDLVKQCVQRWLVKTNSTARGQRELWTMSWKSPVQAAGSRVALWIQRDERHGSGSALQHILSSSGVDAMRWTGSSIEGYGDI